MATLSRQTQKVFASNADADQIAVFGSMKTGTPVYSTNLATLQSTAYTEGWAEALLSDKAPYMEEMNAVQYGLSYQIAYLLQEGAPEYDANTNYSDTSIVKVIDSNGLSFYRSLVDDNLGNSLSDTDYWVLIPIANVQSQLAEKADVDLANTTPSQTFKDMSMSWGMVDYANGIDLQGLSTYTCPDDGFINISGLTAATTVVLKRNNIPIGNACYQNYVSSSCFVPVYKGDVLTIFITQTSAATTFPNYSTFYPMKGAN